MYGLKFRGRPPIRFAESVQDVVHFKNPYTQAIADRSVPMTEEFVDAVIAQSIFGWEGRHPAPVLDEDGNFQGTDLDLLSFLVPIAERGAVIELPSYRSRRVSVAKANERHIGEGNRFGAVTGLTSNQDVFSFSIRIWDNTVVVRDPETERESVGAFRNFMLVDVTGKWHDGWDRIVWDPIAKENDFLTKNGLWTGNTVYFKNAVHPNRWQSVFGAPYLLLKMLIERLREESSFYRQEVTRLEAHGLELPEGEKKESGPTVSSVEQQKIKVETLEALIDMPVFNGTYRSVPNTEEGLVQAYRHQKKLTWTLKPKAQLVVRADELAYFLYGKDRVASWMSERGWKTFTPPRGRTVWKQMVLSNDVAYRFRRKIVTETVATNFS
ncbi:MAG: hypothetical protein A3G49_06615 [Candidatus Sungbacteria bacterium RIFCSPLOWO2_12_FULL_41_11]|uniref:Uncharacterized protein n=1 Tax=Candidatus Sungbacteria bacterium RIFCSPLOWO2_12_FULL_41_11 TaxID=1802286 RepID=A0A1G2LS80_9BACT|nr:MAG: hypothetical protein UV01_C0003G0100 [Parcubacteria group bacterium GW2011_GWA2_42_14]OHA14490.1 MAG: hypothetical protein A3G49_06615 [Candidatus Sungbacteria bacterium RIFCSPLOWO2_12_FULL_41_11]